jgi:hypothetical protein
MGSNVEAVLLLVFSRPLRWCTAGLSLAGTGLAGTSAVLAFTRLGAGTRSERLAFATVAVVLAVLAAAVLYAARWALWIIVVLS